MIQIHRGPEALAAQVVCTGEQLARVIGEVGRLVDVCWYTADIARNDGAATSTTPVRVGSSEEMAVACTAFDQLAWGVFSAVPAASQEVALGERWAEGAAPTKTAPAIVEIRAFDTSYIEILTEDDRIARHFVDAYGVKESR